MFSISRAVYLTGRSDPLQKVNLVNSQAVAFPPSRQIQVLRPGSQADQPVTVLGSAELDVKAIGTDGEVCPYSIFLQPYCEAGPGTSFYLNVWGYSPAGGENPQGSQVWVPFFIVQLYCVSANIPGVVATNGYLTQGENLCDTIQIPTNPNTGLPVGSVGTGWISSPGQDYAAYARIDMMGAKEFLVEFAQDPQAQSTPANPVPGMNALWRGI